MTKFGQKGNITDKDFMIHILNNLPEDNDVILNGLENCLMATRDKALTVDVIHEKLNHQYKQKRRKTEKEKALGAYIKQYKQRCHMCGMATNLVIKNVLKIKMKKKKSVRI